MPNANRAAQRDGYRVPAELLLLAELLTDLAERHSPRQTATLSALRVGDRHAEVKPDPMLLTMRQAAVLSASVRTVERLIASGELAAVRVGGSTKLRRVNVDAFVAALESPRSLRDATTSKEPA